MDIQRSPYLSSMPRLAEPASLGHAYAALPVHLSASGALPLIRAQAPAGEMPFHCYVVDGEGRLLGEVPLHRLLTADPEIPVARLLIPVARARDDFTDEQVEDLFILHRFHAVPVVNAAGQLLGEVELDRAIEGYAQALEMDVRNASRKRKPSAHGSRRLGRSLSRGDLTEMLAFLGIARNEASLRTPWAIARRRLPYFIFNMIGGTLAALISSLFAGSLKRVVTLSFFIPIVLMLAESAGTQAAAAAHQSRQRISLTVTAALTVGSACGISVAALSAFWAHSLPFALAIGLAVVLSMTSAATLGTLAPTFFNAIGLDPALASAPAVLAASDGVSLIVYLGIATWMLRS